MRMHALALLCAFIGHMGLVLPAEAEEAGWPHWRGPQANGVALRAEPPLEWDQQTNIRWKQPIPGEGSATPIVWGNRVFILSAVPTERKAENPPEPHPEDRTVPPPYYYQFTVFCLDRESGELLWKRVAREAVPHTGRHTTHTYAAGSPTTDGERLYVSFCSQGIYCYDLEGNLQWERDLGRMRTRRGWGEANTPVVHGDSLVVNWDQEDQSFITVLEAATGKERWRKDREEPTSWSTPLVVEHAGRTQVIVNATHRVRAYDLADGEVIWECGGQTVNAIPSPLLFGESVICMSGYQSALAVAAPLAARGDITDTDALLWKYTRGTPYVPSGIVVGEQVYFTRTNTAVLTSLEAATGKPVFAEERLPEVSSFYASPVAAGERIYFTSREGTTLVLRHGPKLEVLAVNRLDDPIDASPALVGRQLFLRSAGHVYCIEEPREASE